MQQFPTESSLVCYVDYTEQILETPMSNLIVTVSNTCGVIELALVPCVVSFFFFKFSSSCSLKASLSRIGLQMLGSLFPGFVGSQTRKGHLSY